MVAFQGIDNVEESHSFRDSSDCLKRRLRLEFRANDELVKLSEVYTESQASTRVSVSDYWMGPCRGGINSADDSLLQ